MGNGISQRDGIQRQFTGSAAYYRSPEEVADLFIATISEIEDKKIQIVAAVGQSSTDQGIYDGVCRRQKDCLCTGGNGGDRTMRRPGNTKNIRMFLMDILL